MLADVSATRLTELAVDEPFLAHLDELAAERRAYLEGAGWFASSYGSAALGGVAYFSMEFGLGEALPLYAGGLGVLPGDFLKTASDLGVPVIGIGLRRFLAHSGSRDLTQIKPSKAGRRFSSPGQLALVPAV